jgi:hypothetical protein
MPPFVQPVPGLKQDLQEDLRGMGRQGRGSGRDLHSQVAEVLRTLPGFRAGRGDPRSLLSLLAGKGSLTIR